MYSVYVLQNTRNQKVYVGFSGNPAQRWKDERREAFRSAGASYGTLLSKAIRKYGWDAFTQQVIEEWPTKEAALEAECFWIEFFRSDTTRFGGGCGYNLTSGGDKPPSWEGKILAPETRAKISRAHKGLRLGKVASPETRAKMSAAKRGRERSLETRAKIGASNRGKKRSQEICDRIGDAHRGKTISAEMRAKQSAALKGRKKSPETIARSAASRRGLKRSPEVRANMVEAWKKRRAAAEENTSE